MRYDGLIFELSDRLQNKLLEKSRGQEYVFPEEVLAKIAYSTYSALWYLKEAHSVIHRSDLNLTISKSSNLNLT